MSTSWLNLSEGFRREILRRVRRAVPKVHDRPRRERRARTDWEALRAKREAEAQAIRRRLQAEESLAEGN